MLSQHTIQHLFSSVLKYSAVVFIAIGILARIFLVYTQLNLPHPSFSDFGRDILVARHIFDNNILIAPQSSIPILKNTPLYFWLLGSAYAIGNETGVYLVFLGIGLLQIYLAYTLGNKISKSTGLLFAALISTNIIFIKLSSEIWQPNIVPLFILAWMNFIMMYKKTKKSKHLLISLLFFYLALFFHYSGILLLPIVTIISLYLIFYSGKSLR